MHRLSIALKKQKREIEKLKRTRIGAYRGFRKERILYFSDHGFQYADERNRSDPALNLIGQ